MQIRPFVSSLKIIIYLFLAVVGTLVVVSGGYSLVAVHGGGFFCYKSQALGLSVVAPGL